MIAATNPILPGCHPDPSICRVGDDYYLVTSTFEYLPGLPILRSHDLVRWETIGHAIDRPGMLDFDGIRSAGGLYAPTIRHDGERFWIVCTLVDPQDETRGGNFLITATDAAGPWSDPIRLDVDGIDPSVAFAFATGVSIATYTAIDRAGARLIDPLTYAAILWITASVALVIWLRFAARSAIFAGAREQIRYAAIGGWLTLAAYVLILWALSLAPLSGVAPLRESAAVFAAAWGSVRLGEAADRGDIARRVGASVLIVAGALLLALGG